MEAQVSTWTIKFNEAALIWDAHTNTYTEGATLEAHAKTTIKSKEPALILEAHANI